MQFILNTMTMRPLTEVMPLSANLVWFIRIILYTAIVVTSFAIFIPLAISVHRHDGNCVLYARKDNSYGRKSTCDYCITDAVLFNLVYPVVFVVAGVHHTVFHKHNPLSDLNSIIFIVNVGVDAFLCLLALINSCIITVGLNTICESITDELGSTCDQVAIVTPAKERIFFYSVLSTAEIAAWICFLFWLAQVAIGGMTVYQTKRGSIVDIPVKSDR